MQDLFLVPTNLTLSVSRLTQCRSPWKLLRHGGGRTEGEVVVVLLLFDAFTQSSIDVQEPSSSLRLCSCDVLTAFDLTP